MTIPRFFLEYAVFIDTSAFYAFLDRSDRWHGEALSYEEVTKERSLRRYGERPAGPVR